jgi:hypothetical protein
MEHVLGSMDFLRKLYGVKELNKLGTVHLCRVRPVIALGLPSRKKLSYK